jgi:hypothetical protein
MRMTVKLLVASTMLSVGCAAQPVIPDPTVPHRVAKEVEVVVWVRLPDGSLQKQTVRVLPGWWIAGPPVVDPDIQ